MKDKGHALHSHDRDDGIIAFFQRCSPPININWFYILNVKNVQYHNMLVLWNDIAKDRIQCILDSGHMISVVPTAVKSLDLILRDYSEKIHQLLLNVPQNLNALWQMEKQIETLQSDFDSFHQLNKVQKHEKLIIGEYLNHILSVIDKVYGLQHIPK